MLKSDKFLISIAKAYAFIDRVKELSSNEIIKTARETP